MRFEYGVEVDEDTFNKIRSLDEERRRIFDEDIKEALKNRVNVLTKEGQI